MPPKWAVSSMKNAFAPPPPLPSINIPAINKILISAQLSPITNTDIDSYRGLLQIAQLLESLCEISSVNKPNSDFRLILKISHYRERKRYRSSTEARTITAVYSNRLSHGERRERLHPSLWHFRRYNRAVEQAGRLRGRLTLYKNPFITRTCAKIDKSGLITELTRDVNSLKGIDTASIIFVALATAEFSVRKVS
jgi:hypothetical protein